jgi:hypothetical protein
VAFSFAVPLLVLGLGAGILAVTMGPPAGRHCGQYLVAKYFLYLVSTVLLLLGGACASIGFDHRRRARG